MLCCSISCKHFDSCGHSYINNPYSHEVSQEFDRGGSADYVYNSSTKRFEIKNFLMCENYNMYYPTNNGENKQCK